MAKYRSADNSFTYGPEEITGNENSGKPESPQKENEESVSLDDLNGRYKNARDRLGRLEEEIIEKTSERVQQTVAEATESLSNEKRQEAVERIERRLQALKDTGKNTDALNEAKKYNREPDPPSGHARAYAAENLKSGGPAEERNKKRKNADRSKRNKSKEKKAAKRNEKGRKEKYGSQETEDGQNPREADPRSTNYNA